MTFAVGAVGYCKIGKSGKRSSGSREGALSPSISRKNGSEVFENPSGEGEVQSESHE